MEKLAASGDGTFAHLSQTSNYITVPLDTIIKDQKILSYGGPTAFKSGWKQTSPLQTSNFEQILTQNQQNYESYLRQSTVSFYRPTGQSRNSFTPVLPNANYPQHNSLFCSNARPPEISATGEKVLDRQCPIQSSSSSFEYQKASLALKTINSSQQSHIPSMFVLNANNLSGSWKNNLFNQQQHVNITNNLPKDSISQGLFTGFILAQAPVITLQPLTNKIQTNETPLHQQNACMPKDIYQQKYATQKAVAVVTPLTQVAVAGVTLSNNLSEVKEGDPQRRSVSKKNDHQPYIPHTCQSTTNESGAKSLNDSIIQTKEVPSKSVLAPGLFHCLKDDGPAENDKLPGLSERLASVSFNSVRIQSREEVQQPSTGDDSSVKLLRDNDATVMSSNSVGTNMRMDARMDTLSTIPVEEWSLQRLHDSIIQMEQTQKSQQKDLPYDNLFDEILKLYWNGDYKKLCNAAKSNLYKDIIKEVRLCCSTENSVILQGVSTERLNEIASSVHILEHGTEPPKMGYTSSWLNLTENLHDIDKEHGYLSTLMTLQSKNKIAAKEAPVREMENRPELSKEKLKACDKALSGGEEQRKPLPPEHQQNSCVQDDKTVRSFVGVNVEKMCSEKVIEGQNSTNVKNVILERVQLEQPNTTVGENQAPLLTSSSTNPGILFKLHSKDTMPVLDKDDSVKMSILPLEKAEEPNVDVDNMIKEDAQLLTDSSQVTVELFEEDKKCIDMEIKSDEMSKGIKINWKLEKYCCLTKWFQVLGYRNEGLCKCEKKSELSHHADASGEDVKEVNADQNRYPFNKACKLNDTDICELRDSKQAKNDKNGQKPLSVTSLAVDDGSMDELEIVEVITNFEDVVKLAHAMSEQVKDMPLLTHTSHESTSRRDHKECKTGETLRNLVLFGALNVRPGKNISGFMSSDKVHLPPETVNIRIGSDWNENPNSTKSPKSLSSKQQVWNSWKKAHVLSAMTPYRRSKRQKRTKAPASKSDENTSCLTSADKQKNTDGDQSKKKSRKKISLTRQDQIRKLKRNKMLASINLKKRRNYAHRGSKLMKSSLDSAQVINPSKKKLNTGLALNFRVLPESFNISDDGSSVKANQSASAESSKYFVYGYFIDFIPSERILWLLVYITFYFLFFFITRFKR